MARAVVAMLVGVVLGGCRLHFDPYGDGDCEPDELYAEMPSGSGTEDNPIRVCTVEQLGAGFAQLGPGAGYIELGRDLDFEGVAFDGIPLFGGHFDGRGYTIRNVALTSGLITNATRARIENLRLENAQASGGEHVGTLIGACESSHVERVTIVDAVVVGEIDVGGIVGEANRCQFHDSSVAATVTATTGPVGGIAGRVGSTSLLNVEATVDVNAPFATAVGGAFGEDWLSPNTMQNVALHGTVVGKVDVGGFVGANNDGTIIYRSTFDGTIRGERAVGGFAGSNNDIPFRVYSSSVVAEITGTDAVGGFSGGYYYTGNFIDSYFTGRLLGTGTGQRAFGGFFGEGGYSGVSERSYVDATIESDASTVGGFIGDLSYWSTTSDIARSFAITNIAGSSATDTVSYWIGENTSGDVFVGDESYFWSGGTCVNRGGGTCTSGPRPVADRAAFEDRSSLPLATWDFARVWRSQTGGLPTLRLEQTAAPTMTLACPSQAISGYIYQCEIAASDGDVNELALPTLEHDHGCDWLRGAIIEGQTRVLVPTLRGVPLVADGGTCRASLSFTDGVNRSSPGTFSLDVHRGVIVAVSGLGTPSPIATFLNIQVGSSETRLLTLVNQELVDATFSITGLPSGPFAYTGGTFPGTGGTCGTTLAASATCTISVTFTPTAVGSAEVDLDIQFTAARGPVNYWFKLFGFGN